MQIAMWIAVSIVSGSWAYARAKDDIEQQRLIGNTFGEAHLSALHITRYAVPTLAAALTFSFSIHEPSAWVLLAFIACVATSCRVSLIDIDTHTIPKRVMVTSSSFLLVLLFITSVMNEKVTFVSVLMGGVLSWCFMKVIEVVSRGAMGHADVVFAGFLGLFLGAIELSLIPLALFSAFVSAGLVAVAMMLTKRMTRASYLPFGPFLFAGMLLAVLR